MACIEEDLVSWIDSVGVRLPSETVSSGDWVRAWLLVAWLSEAEKVSVGVKVSVAVGGGSTVGDRVSVSVGSTVADSVGCKESVNVSVAGIVAVSVGNTVKESVKVSVKIIEKERVGFRVMVVRVSVISSLRLGVGGGVIVGVTVNEIVWEVLGVGGGVMVALEVQTMVFVSVSLSV